MTNQSSMGTEDRMLKLFGVEREVSNESDENSEAIGDGRRVMMRAWLGNFAELAIFNLIGQQALQPRIYSLSDSTMQLSDSLISLCEPYSI